jgi:hypothetical protein
MRRVIAAQAGMRRNIRDLKHGNAERTRRPKPIFGTRWNWKFIGNDRLGASATPRLSPREVSME